MKSSWILWKAMKLPLNHPYFTYITTKLLKSPKHPRHVLYMFPTSFLGSSVPPAFPEGRFNFRNKRRKKEPSNPINFLWNPINPYLVGGIPNPLKNMIRSVGIYDIPTIWKNNPVMFQKNHQSDIVFSSQIIISPFFPPPFPQHIVINHYSPLSITITHY